MSTTLRALFNKCLTAKEFDAAMSIAERIFFKASRIELSKSEQYASLLQDYLELIVHLHRWDKG